MRKTVIIGLLSWLLCLTTGCSIYPIRMIVVKGKNPKGQAGIRLIDPNDWSAKITISDKKVTFHERPIIELKKPCRVKYGHLLYDFDPKIFVTGEIQNGEKYTVIIDTGCSGFIEVNDRIVCENKLPVYSIDLGPSIGLCEFSSLTGS